MTGPEIIYSSPTVHGKALRDSAGIVTYIGFCCREWVLAVTIPSSVGRCGLCGEKPTYLREDDHERVFVEDPS